MTHEIIGENAMKAWAEQLGVCLAGGELIELIGDVGAGKTTLVKGLAVGLGIDEDIQSPSFTISRVYDARNDLQMAHYDFYRLHDAGIMADEIREVMDDPRSIVVIEWANIVNDVLPADRLTIRITSPTETTRVITLEAGGVMSQALLEKLA